MGRNGKFPYFFLNVGTEGFSVGFLIEQSTLWCLIEGGVGISGKGTLNFSTSIFKFLPKIVVASSRALRERLVHFSPTSRLSYF